MRVLRYLVALFLGIASTCFAQQSTWTLFTPSGFGPRGGGGSQSTAYDAATDRLIVFGGYNPTGSGETNDVWVLINATGAAGVPTWQQVIPNAPAGLPATRQAHSAVYDRATNRLIIFGGGQAGGGAFSVLFQDVWVLTFANNAGGTPQWIPLTPSGGPPAPREGHAAVYNQATNEMFLFGGGNNGIMSVPNDLWVLEAANGIGTPTWIQLSETGNVPGRLENFASAYDQASNRWTVVGGCCFYTNASEVLALNQPNGVPQWTSLSPSGTLPPGGDAAVYGYDPVSNRMIVHGIQPGGGGNGTWLLTNANAVGATSAWINLIPESAPGSPTEGANRVGSAYNPGTKKFIHAVTLVDGQGNLVPEVWVLSNADGTAAAPTPTGLAATVGNHTVYLHWDSPASSVDGYNVDVYQFDVNTTVPVHLGTLFAKDPSATISKLPDGTFVANGFLYGFTVQAVIGTSLSAPSNEVFARAGEFAVSQPPPHRDHPILFLHGICIPEVSITTDATSWNTTKDFLLESLHWNFGGTLTYFLNNDPRITQPLVVNANGGAFLDPNGDFFTSSFGNCSGTYTVDGTGILHQGDEVRGFLRALPSQVASKGISIVAHSMGGLSARSYIADNQTEATQLVKEFITYGSPHWGVTRAATDALVNFSDGANDLKFDCSQIGGSFHADYSGNPFLNRLRLIVLPEGIRYFAIRGESSNLNLPFAFFTSLLLLPSPCFSQLWDGLIQTDSADFNGRSIPPVGGQLFPSSAPSDQVSITPHLAGLLTTNRNHSMEQSDFSAILCALDTNCAILQVKSPVDIEVIAPNGQQMSKGLAAMPGAEYMDILEEDGHETATVLIPFPQGGQYTISAIPKPGTLPTDTFTITLTQNGVTTTIADHTQIQSIPPDGFHPHVNSRPFANAGVDQTAECAGPNGTPVTLNGSASGDQDGDTLTYRWTDPQGNVAGNSAIVTTLVQMGTQTYTLTVTDPSGLSATAQTHTTVRDTTPPLVTSSVALPGGILQQNNHTMTNVGLAVAKSDICTTSPTVTVRVFGNEDDQTPTDNQGTVFSPDANNIAPGTLRLRAERSDSGPGRVYLIVVKAIDGAGNFSLSASTVVVPKSTSAASTSAVNTLAAAARAFALNPTNKNNPQPPGYFVIGDGPLIGSKQ
jgi:hypothetical protein